MARKLLIAGIDPGTTAGYALVRTDGKLLKTMSSKGMGIDRLVSEMTREGRIIAIGTDRRKCPLIIEKFAAKTGARLIKPKQDISVREKLGVKARNEHERDAVAAALFAYRELKPLLRKIEIFARRQEREDITKEVTEIVVMRKVGITKTINNIGEK